VCWLLYQLQATDLVFSACGLLCHVLLLWKSVTLFFCFVVFVLLAIKLALGLFVQAF